MTWLCHHCVGVAAVFIMVGMVSPALRDQVKALVPDGAPVVYLRSASISALRKRGRLSRCMIFR